MATAYFQIGYKDKLPEIMRRDNFTYFEICDAKDKVLVFCPTGYSADDAASYLSESLDGIQDGEFSVNLYQSDKKKSVNKTFAFKIPAAQQIAGVGFSQDRLDFERQKLEWRFEKMLEEQNKKHQAEIEGLKQNSGGITGVLNNLQGFVDKYPIIGDILNNWANKLVNPQQAAINGVEQGFDKNLQRISAAIGGDQALKDLVQVVADRVTGDRAFEFMVKLQAFFKEFDEHGKKN